MLGALRNFNCPLMNLRNGDWRGKQPPPLGHDPEGKVLGILGMGGIGRDLEKKAEAFGMKVVYHNRNKLNEEMSGGARYVSFEELLKTSDVISLNVPLNVSPPCALGNLIADVSGIHTPHDINPPIRPNERERSDC